MERDTHWLAFLMGGITAAIVTGTMAEYRHKTQLHRRINRLNGVLNTHSDQLRATKQWRDSVNRQLQTAVARRDQTAGA